ncbi:hypothetical protein QJS04_geneDACA020095 [Acorus gramineus]|uniref:AMP-activated protein kinase glycogen-binding domain-containing protein n=1 Tax=Acorus gramineus TaxID=55184 RepID=A0AAV9A653_ACOGR|nr:hypothetical protein QJS04_geneDACA020095 [Acorus gramineus]
MLQSNHPNDFPTKDELIASGRMDLVEKIALQGGWFTFGWDLDSSMKEIHRLSDAWEFKETEIMNTRGKLRSLRASLAVLEGKMALKNIEAQGIVEEKQWKIDYALKALQLLRTACIVWPNPASEVWLAGSFDGWTSQRRMERSSSGIFCLNLKLYPGRYEIKFIVDGTWRIDPLRPIVNYDGYENNLLLVV